MLKEALKYIIDLSKPTIETINGQTYSDKALHRINHNPKATAIKLNTLSSLIEYLDKGNDVCELPMFVHI